MPSDFEDYCRRQLLRRTDPEEDSIQDVNQMSYLCNMVNAETKDNKRLRYRLPGLRGELIEKVGLTRPILMNLVIAVTLVSAFLGKPTLTNGTTLTVTVKLPYQRQMITLLTHRIK